MKRSILILLMILTIFGSQLNALRTQGDLTHAEKAQQVTQRTEDLLDLQELEAFIDGIMATHLISKHIAGATFSLVKDGEIFFAKGYGYADMEKRQPVIADQTLFRAGSVSKLFTWTAVMQLMEQGMLDLDEDVNNYLEEFKIPETYPRPITLKHLLTHTPGFEDVWTGMMARTAEDLVPTGNFLAENIPERVFPPGEITAYSNYGTALAGYIVEKVSGLPFEEYVEQYIFKPLDMQRSTFRQPLPAELESYMSRGYDYKKGLFEEEDFELINGLAPAGSMSTTAMDMAKFMIAHLQKGQYGESRILKEETAELMHTQLFTHDPRLDGNAFGFWERTQNNIWMIGHGGDLKLFHTLLMLMLEQNIGLFFSYNSVGGSGPPREELLQAFLDRYFPVLEISEPKPPPDFKKRAGRFTGSYSMTRGIFTTYEKIAVLFSTIKVKATDEGTLLIPFPAGLGTKQWVEVDPLVFKELGGKDTLIFKEDARGHITHAYLDHYPYFACYKLAWYETSSFHYFLLGMCAILFLSTSVWPIRKLYRAVCRRKREEKKGPGLARWLAAMMSLLFVIFLGGMITILSDAWRLGFGVPGSLKVLLAIAITASVLAVGVLVFTILAWMKKYWYGCARLHYTLVLAAALAFIWFLNYWNLLGFRF